MIKASGGGAIVNMASAAAKHGYAYRTPYSAAKFGVVGLTQSLAKELGPDNIRVNCIAPGLVKTDFAKALWTDPERSSKRLAGTPMARLGEPEDLAGIAVYLSSRAGAYLTGTVIPVDGGISTCK